MNGRSITKHCLEVESLETVEKTVTDVIDEVKTEICFKYCKYFDVKSLMDEESANKVLEKCARCPLNRL